MRKIHQTAEVLLFRAEWSGSSVLIRSIVKKVMNAYDENVIFRVIDVDRHDEIARQYGITRIPVLLFIKNGVVHDSLTGIAGESEIIGKIDRLLNQHDDASET
jgi:thioredoxin 1